MNATLNCQPAPTTTFFVYRIRDDTMVAAAHFPFDTLLSQRIRDFVGRGAERGEVFFDGWFIIHNCNVELRKGWERREERKAVTLSLQTPLCLLLSWQLRPDKLLLGTEK